MHYLKYISCNKYISHEGRTMGKPGEYNIILRALKKDSRSTPRSNHKLSNDTHSSSEWFHNTHSIFCIVKLNNFITINH